MQLIFEYYNSLAYICRKNTIMIHLIISVLIFCSSFGVILSKMTKAPAHRSERRHVKLLTLD